MCRVVNPHDLCCHPPHTPPQHHPYQRGLGGGITLNILTIIIVIILISINIHLLILIMGGWVVAYACQEWSSVHRSLRDLTTRLLHYIELHYIALK